MLQGIANVAWTRQSTWILGWLLLAGALATCTEDTPDDDAGGVQCPEGTVRDGDRCVMEDRDCATQETCNGQDDDCDGETDEDAEGVGDPCGPNDGVCQRGTQTCANGELLCDGVVEQGDEVCDGVDNDCDDQIDEGLLNGCGSCGEPTDEVCDGVDNDCDGLIDEDLQAACFENTANVNSPLGTNLVQPTDFSNEFPFVDHMKMARPWFSGTVDQFQDDRSLAKDADGWPNALEDGQVARSVIFTNTIDASQRAGTRFIVLKSGDGDVDHGNVTIDSSSSARDVITLTENLWTLIITRTNPDDPIKIRIVPEGGICTSNPLRRVDEEGDCPGGDFKSFEAVDGPRFMPEFLDTIKAYRYLRFMDWGHTNRTVQNEIDADPDLIELRERALVDHATWTQPLRGVPVEVMIELCNLMGMDIWFHIPYRASDAYVDGVAAIIRDQLGSGRKVYVEYSNEVWNGIFVQTDFARQQGEAMGLGTDPFTATIEFYALRATQVMKRFEAVFGGTSRLFRVVATLQGNGFAVETILGFRDTADHIDFFAIAPYFGDTAGEGSFPLEGRNRGGTPLTPDQEIARFKQMGVDGLFDWLLNDTQPDLFGSLEGTRSPRSDALNLV